MKKKKEEYSYEYFRSIGRSKRGDKEIFLGFVSIIKSEVLYNSHLRQYYNHRIESVEFSKIEPIENVHPLLLKLPIGDVTYELNQFSYKTLEELSHDNEIAFWLYLSLLS